MLGKFTARKMMNTGRRVESKQIGKSDGGLINNYNLYGNICIAEMNILAIILLDYWQTDCTNPATLLH